MTKNQLLLAITLAFNAALQAVPVSYGTYIALESPYGQYLFMNKGTETVCKTVYVEGWNESHTQYAGRPEKQCEVIIHKGTGFYSSPTGGDENRGVWIIVSPPIVGPGGFTFKTGDVHYGDKISLQNAYTKMGNKTFLGSEDDKQSWAISTDREKAGSYENWTPVNPNNPNDKSVINSGDQVAFKSNFGRYLTVEIDKTSVNANETSIGAGQKWRVIKQ